MSEFKRPNLLPDNLPDPVPYALVRRIFKWETNRGVRYAVETGKLTRVQTTNNTKGARITAESVRTLHEEMIELAEAGKQFEVSPGRMKAMRQAKKQRDSAPVPEVTAELDAREIIRQAHNLDKTPAPPMVSTPSVAHAAGPQSQNELLGAWYNARGTAKVQAYRALDWRTKNKLIEQGLV
ncbi:MAG: hypothetical protein ACJ72H_28585 [Candidatus Sulfotelmatobacter sp.]